jgi:hypothetical protein
MDNQDQQPPVHTEPVSNQAIAPAAPITTTGPRTSQSALDIPDKAAQALLTINGLGSSQKPKIKLSPMLIIAILVLVLLVALSDILLGKAKPSGSIPASSSTTSGESSQSDTSANKNATNQINQYVNSCTNPVNAASEC